MELEHISQIIIITLVNNIYHSKIKFNKWNIGQTAVLKNKIPGFYFVLGFIEKGNKTKQKKKKKNYSVLAFKKSLRSCFFVNFLIWPYNSYFVTRSYLFICLFCFTAYQPHRSFNAESS